MYDIYFVSMWQTECWVHLNLSSENIEIQSVLQGNNGPRCLSSEGYKICRGATFDQALAIEEVANVQMKEILRATAACCSEEEFAEVITKHADQIAQYGYPKIYTVN